MEQLKQYFEDGKLSRFFNDIVSTEDTIVRRCSTDWRIEVNSSIRIIYKFTMIRKACEYAGLNKDACDKLINLLANTTFNVTYLGFDMKIDSVSHFGPTTKSIRAIEHHNFSDFFPFIKGMEKDVPKVDIDFVENYPYSR